MAKKRCFLVFACICFARLFGRWETIFPMGGTSPERGISPGTLTIEPHTIAVLYEVVEAIRVASGGRTFVGIVQTRTAMRRVAGNSLDSSVLMPEVAVETEVAAVVDEVDQAFTGPPLVPLHRKHMAPMVVCPGEIARSRSGDQIIELRVPASPCVHAYRIQRQIEMDLSILGRVAWVGTWVFTGCSLHGRSSVFLLYDMRKLMRQQVAAGGRTGIILAVSEYDVVPTGVSMSIDCLGRCRSLFIRMDSNPTEIVAEACLHKLAGCRAQRLAGCG